MKKPGFLVSALIGAVVATGALSLLHAADKPQPKGYVIGEIDVTDAEGYKAYAAAAGPVVAKFGGTYLVRGGRTVTVEGKAPAGRVVLVEFASAAAAEKFENSEEYRKVAEARHRTATSRLFIAEGLAP